MKYLFMVSSIKFSKFNQFSFVPYILLLYVSLLSIPIFAQVEAEIYRPSINAEQFGFALKAETALNKGQLSVNIPLMTLKGKGYDLPISLTFYNGDVNSFTEASPIGLGWALMAGGVITCTQRGRDDTNTYYSIEHQKDGDYITKNWKNNDDFFVFEIQNNPMPDEYTYSIPGHSGIIDISVEDDKISSTLFPDESYKIESIKGGYLITADDGTKFYFKDWETQCNGSDPEFTASTSWFLSEIITIKGGKFKFNYADEEYYDLTSTKNFGLYPNLYRTKRITSIVSELDSVSFVVGSRLDRGVINDKSKCSRRIIKIEWRNKNGEFVKGFKLDNSGLFGTETRYEECFGADETRHKLSSITQYDSVGNCLPPYKFHYSYSFWHSKRIVNTTYNENWIPCNSWTSCVGSQAYVDLNQWGFPLCHREHKGTEFENVVGYTEGEESNSITSRDFLCIDSIYYPTGAIDIFTYEKHDYSKVNNTRSSNSAEIQGKRLASKIRYSDSGLEQRTRYVYKLHDSAYESTEVSSGVLTNPSIHCATYYTPERDGDNWVFRASRISSSQALNSFMGPPVCYSEVEEIIYGEGYDSLRTITYFSPQIVSPPINYIYMHPQPAYSYEPSNSSLEPKLTKIDNVIFGTLNKYWGDMEYLNERKVTYIAYPVGDFYNVSLDTDQPLKEVFIGKNGKVRSIKQHWYNMGPSSTIKKYGYKIVKQDYFKKDIWGSPQLDYTAYLISQSEYITRKYRFKGTSTTYYYYDKEKCDSIYENYGIGYNKGRIASTSYSRNKYLKEKNYIEERIDNYFPDDIKMKDVENNNSSSMIKAINGMIEKNIVADPIKTIVWRNEKNIDGECRGYQMPDSIPLLKSLYKIKNSTNKYPSTPTVSADTIDYHAELYKEGDVLTYDNYRNPEHVKLHDTQDRYYIWGYGGRYPIAVIDNIDDEAFANLKPQIIQLENYKKIHTEAECASLRDTNASIRGMLPASAHITTYTYDPYFGMTSEIDDSNLGVIYTYDTFGRLTAKYDENYKKLEEYNYHLKLQE